MRYKLLINLCDEDEVMKVMMGTTMLTRRVHAPQTTVCLNIPGLIFPMPENKSLKIIRSGCIYTCGMYFVILLFTKRSRVWHPNMCHFGN